MTSIEPIVGRYAPSPTGPQHLGNLRTAILAWLQARLSGGAFILRIENLDLPRNLPGSAEQVIDDLKWLGLDWDQGAGVGGDHQLYDQSARYRYYQQTLDRLKAMGKAYPCACSRKDIRLAASAPHQVMPIYPGSCRNLEETVVNARCAELGRAPSWRFRVDDVAIEFDDQLMGHHRQRLSQAVGDFVLCRADGVFAYQLAVVIDDALMGVTDVVRGADLLDSTPRQIALYQALGWPVPRFWHVPLLHDEVGERMSKRNGSASLEQLRTAGHRPEQVVGELLAGLGLIESGRVLSLQQALSELDLETFRACLQQM